MNPQHALTTIAELAQAAAVCWPQYEATSAALASSTIPSGGGDGRGSDVSDPVHQIVASHEPYNECAAQIAEAVGILRNVQTRMSNVRRSDPQIAREHAAAMKAMRCDGSVEPTCTNNAVKGGRCWRCIKRVQREAERADGAA